VSENNGLFNRFLTFGVTVEPAKCFLQAIELHISSVGKIKPESKFCEGIVARVIRAISPPMVCTLRLLAKEFGSRLVHAKLTEWRRAFHSSGPQSVELNDPTKRVRRGNFP